MIGTVCGRRHLVTADVCFVVTAQCNSGGVGALQQRWRQICEYL